MADALDNIFSALMKSEMIAQVGKQKHKEVRDAVEQLKLRIKKQESQKAVHMTKKSQLELAVADVNIAVKILKVKEEWMNNELREVEEKVKLEENRHGKVNKNMDELYEEFIKTVETFSADYSLSSSGAERRILSAKECLRSLEMDKHKLKLDVDNTIDFNNELNMIMDKKSKELEELKSITSKIEEIDNEIDNDISCTNDLENKISQLITEPDYGSEFMRIKEELQNYEVTELQSDINKLQTELKTLSTKLHKKEAQSLRLQYRHWQRQQNQKPQTNVKKTNEQRTSLNISSCTNGETNDPASFYDEDMTAIPDESIKIEAP